jgi:pentatricopeptide repeat protein
MCPAPDMSGLPKETYRYELFPKLLPSLYTPPRLGPSAAGTQLKRTGTASQLKETATQEQTVHTIWFMIFASLMARGSHVDKGIDLAFQVLSNMRKAGIPPDDKVWELLMQVCAAGGSPEKSIKLLAEMQSVGFTADAHSYSSLLHVLARSSSDAIHKPSGADKDRTPITVPQSIVSAVAELKKNWGNAPTPSPSPTSPTTAAAGAGGASSATGPPVTSPSERKQRTSNATAPRPKGELVRFLDVSLLLTLRLYDVIAGFYESLFEHLFPGLSLNSSDSCPKCHKGLKD